MYRRHTGNRAIATHIAGALANVAESLEASAFQEALLSVVLEIATEHVGDVYIARDTLSFLVYVSEAIGAFPRIAGSVADECSID